ncbi:MAG: hypothetical protein U5N55_09420 [Cypionkella sp.]|nr:hypothetical protein [Cypionkella sp.]
MFDLDARSFAQSPEDVAVKASQPDWEDGDEVAQNGALDVALDGALDEALDGAAGDTGGLSMGQGLHGTIEPDPDWADAAEARVIAELAGEAVAEDIILQARDTFREPNFKSAPQSAPEVLFDEDQLRALVQAIFREEMAGPMGERITRNIRKLVRAEVGRMLAAQELE